MLPVIPVTQTRVGFPSGNCTEACIASILGLPLEVVPDLYDPNVDHTQDDARHPRWLAMHAWLLGRNLKYVQIRLPPERALAYAGEALGPTVRMMHHLLMGYNPDGIGHAVVALGGLMVWDPNPLRRGIVNPDEVCFLLPASMFPEYCREWPGLDMTPKDAAHS